MGCCGFFQILVDDLLIYNGVLGEEDIYGPVYFSGNDQKESYGQITKCTE